MKDILVGNGTFRFLDSLLEMGRERFPIHNWLWQRGHAEGPLVIASPLQESSVRHALRIYSPPNPLTIKGLVEAPPSAIFGDLADKYKDLRFTQRLEVAAADLMQLDQWRPDHDLLVVGQCVGFDWRMEEATQRFLSFHLVLRFKALFRNTQELAAGGCHLIQT